MERLVSAGIIVSDEPRGGFKSHSEVRSALNMPDPYTSRFDESEGFITDKGRFLSRRGAVPVAVAAGQLDVQWLDVRRDLLSSDINWDGQVLMMKASEPRKPQVIPGESRQQRRWRERKDKHSRLESAVGR